jgi:hypothetical protein
MRINIKLLRMLCVRNYKNVNRRTILQQMHALYVYVTYKKKIQTTLRAFLLSAINLSIEFHIIPPS